MMQTTFSILGDSISTFAGYVPPENEIWYPKEEMDVKQVQHTWWHHLMSRCNLKLLMNESYSGSRISRTGLRPAASCFQDERRQSRLCGDFIIIFGGTNDWGQIDFPAKKSVFEEAYETLVSSMLTRFPSSSLYFCTPLQRTDRSMDRPNIHGWTQRDLSDSIRTIVAKHPKARLIDLASQPIKSGDGMLADNLHPTKAGMEMLSHLMQKGLGLY